MSSVLFSLPELYNWYKEWVSKNPQTIGDYEITAKLVSYFIAGRINNSHVVSELIYCLSNLLVLFNDRIINNCNKIELPLSGDNIKLWLTVLEYSEVFLELSAEKLWGHAGKWLIIVSIQLFKCISRVILLYKHKECIIQNPPIPVMNRKKLSQNNFNNGNIINHNLIQNEIDTISFTLKRSGRTVRKVDSSPSLGLRNWKPIKKSDLCDTNQEINEALSGRQLVAETIYVLKPMAHLAAVGCFGTQAWKPWILSFVLDLASLKLYNTCETANINALSPKQRLQLSRRTVSLLLYLLRSPFYEKNSKNKINALLMSLSKNVPLASFLCNPLLQYLPFWQSCYFYMWST